MLVMPKQNQEEGPRLRNNSNISRMGNSKAYLLGHHLRLDRLCINNYQISSKLLMLLNRYLHKCYLNINKTLSNNKLEHSQMVHKLHHNNCQMDNHSIKIKHKSHLQPSNIDIHNHKVDKWCLKQVNNSRMLMFHLICKERLHKVGLIWFRHNKCQANPIHNIMVDKFLILYLLAKCILELISHKIWV